MLRSSLLCALLAVCACGRIESPDESKSFDAATPAAAGQAQPAEAEQADPDDPLAGLWWVLMPSFPIRAFRVSLSPGTFKEGETRTGTWVTFDWRSTTEAESLQRRSKPVRISATSTGSSLVLEGPTPMLTEGGQPNGQSGRWRIELRRSDLPGEALRWSGTAVHDKGMTGPEGVPAEMERAFRRW